MPVEFDSYIRYCFQEIYLVDRLDLYVFEPPDMVVLS